MENKKIYLVIFDILFVIFIVAFLFTKITFLYFLVIPFYIGTGFSQYYRQKNRLKVQTKEILKLLKLENFIYWLSMSITYILIYYINKPPLPAYREYFIGAIFILFFATYVIRGKRIDLIKAQLGEA